VPSGRVRQAVPRPDDHCPAFSYPTVQDEEQQNEELLGQSTQILELTKAIHAMSAAPTPDA
jgi:hypothetical protein